MKNSALLLALALASAAPAPGFAASEEPRYDSLLQAVKKPYLSLGLLIQTVADFQPERSFAGNNGFQIANARVKLDGHLDGGFGYLLQADLDGTPAVLDARATYVMTPYLALDAGRFKSPFSGEFLTSATSIDFVNRAQAVSALAPGRQIGAQVRGRAAGNDAFYWAGIFNGDGSRAGTNDDGDFLYAARGELVKKGLDSTFGPASLTLGGNAAYSEDTAAAAGLFPAFAGERVLAGGDLRLTMGAWLFAAEGIFGRFTPRGAAGGSVFGHHATAGFRVDPKTMLLVRHDRFDRGAFGPASNQMIVGLNRWETKAVEIQANYVWPMEQGWPENSRFLLNFQAAF